MKFFLCVMGVVLIVEGVPWFLSPQRYKQMLLQMLPIPEKLLRLMGFLSMLCGLVTVYFAMNWTV